MVQSIEAALLAAGGQGEVMVIGGAGIYREVLPRADTIYLTRIHEDFVLPASVVSSHRDNSDL